MRQELRAAIAQALGEPVTGFTPMTGGDINQAIRVTAGSRRYFLKMHPAAPPNFFAAEADGLHRLALAAGESLRIPQVIAWEEGPQPGWLLMEWLATGPVTDEAAGRLGRGLATIHRTLSPTGHYGLDVDNFCGLTPQPNGWQPTWPELCGMRLHHLVQEASKGEHMSGERRRRLDDLIGRLPELLPAHPPASLLHGDLWSGNWLALEDGGAALIDPAISFGDREADLAFTHLFGAFPAAFYAAYQEVWPLEPDAAERRDLLNLYHLLNHLVLFGGSYGAAVDRIVRRYVD